MSRRIFTQTYGQLLRLLIITALTINLTNGKEFRVFNGVGRSVDMRVELGVEEGLPPLTHVGQIPTKPGFTYRFNDNLEDFILNATTGEILTRREIDRESLPSDHFDIVILSSQPTYPIEVRILIKDINDCAPAFPEPEVSLSFSESAVAGTRVFLDTAEDKDSSQNGMGTNYKILDGNEDGHFRLVVTTNPSGEAPFLHLETTGKLDRETKSSYRLNISAQDEGSPPKLGFLILQVSIKDVNDFQPVFEQSQYHVTLNESIPLGSSVLQVKATDKDEGENARISYYLSKTEEQFSIDPETGIITTITQPLNCPKNCQQNTKSCPKSCVLTVFSRDHGTPRQDGRAYVTVTLVESNHPPVIKFRYFPPTSNTANVLERAANASVVAAISVVDLDEGPNGETFVEILSGNELKHFVLESTPSFQLVRTNGVLDREKIPTYNLTITAKDRGNPPCSSTAFLIIEVNDDKEPQISFAKTEYSAVLRESVAIGTYVASITATDETTSIKKSQVIYSIVSGNEKLWFYIDPSSGLLTTRAPLDREQQGIVRLKISARDGGPYPKWAHAQIKISILDENDEYPKFASESLDISLAEDTPPGSLVALTTATDNDQGTNGTITYALSLETELKYPNYFHIDPNSGKVITRSRFDRETRDKYEIKVIAKDQGTPVLSSSALINLSINDVNDNAPKFYPLEYFMRVKEESTVGSVIGQVYASDPDEGPNGKVLYKITTPTGTNNNAKFSIEEQSGKIILKESMRNLGGRSFQLQISAADGGGKSSEDNALIDILVGAQNPTLKFTKEKYTFDIVEDFGLLTPGALQREIGKVELIEGSSSGQVKYSIINGDPFGVFTLERESGALRSSKLIDREEKEIYILEILARKGAHFGYCKVQIRISDLNDKAPQFEFSPIEIKIRKDIALGEEILVLKATDLDASGVNSKVNYTLTSNPSSLFKIDEKKGVISVAKSLREIQIQKINLDITATDGGERAQSSKRNLYITLEEVNQHSPVFDSFVYETSLLESTGVNTRFYTLKAKDADVGLNAEISYEIVDGNSVEKFGIFPDGTLYVKGHLDREERDYFSLLIKASDGGKPQRSSLASFVIHIIDENDQAPKFTNSTFYFEIPENEPPGAFVGKILATDGDMGRNAELTYKFTSNQNSPQFSLDFKNGFIKTLEAFDREQLVAKTGGNQIHLEVQVRDNGAIRLKDKATVIVKITDVNDEAPKFMRGSYTASVSEDAQVLAPVVKVTATDGDEGLNGDLIYFISEGNAEENFLIDQTSGHISLAKLLDRETQDQFTLKVTAQDLAEKNSLSSHTFVIINVQDANDNPPKFISTRIMRKEDEEEEGGEESPKIERELRVLETEEVNKALIQFLALDSDLGENGLVTYSLSNGNRHETFRINLKTGILYLNKALDYEKSSKYILTITASDGGKPKLSSSIEFAVIVLDYNDCAPQFPSTSIVRQIQEGIPLKTPIVTVTAEDADSGVNGEVRYSIKHQEPGGDHFGIDPLRGNIHTLKAIDREFTDTFRLTIVAQDQAMDEDLRLSSEKLVTVIVEDLNDCEPKFTCLNAALLRSNSSSSEEIIKIRAIDLDSESNGMVTYELVQDDSLFKLDRITGSLTLKSAVTNVQPRYQLTIRATDEAVQSQRKSTDFRLMILGVSSESGKSGLSFANEFYSGSINENEPIGSSILSVKASKVGAVGEIEYYITNITSKEGVLQNRLFDVDTKRGTVVTAEILDRESGVSHFVLEIYAILVSPQGLFTASTKVEVEIIDVNDSPPSWPDAKGMRLSVSENAPVGQSIATLVATDEDNVGNLSYSIVKGDAGKFSLDSQTGILRLTNPLDRETQEKWELTVRADDGVQSSDTTLIISVTDTNDNPPLWSLPVYSFDVREDANPGHVVGALEAVDLDKGLNSHITYSILSDWGDDVFSLNPDTGIFTLTAKLDYENVQHYILVVQAEDTGVVSLSSTTTVYLNVLDLNDNSPVFDSKSYSVEIPENVPVGSSVVAVRASDLDSDLNGKVSYMIISGNEENRFVISKNGTIYTSGELDRETKSEYQLQIEASDQSPLNPLSSTVQVSITIGDVNDGFPEFTSADSVSVMENAPLNSVVLVVKAVDLDEGRNGYVEYSLHNEKSTFSLGLQDGLLRIISNIDREKASNYTLKITAKDRGDIPKTSTQQLLITVRDKNDHGPSFESKQYSAAVPENSTVGMNVLQVSASDMDEGLNSQIRYSIVGGDANRDFSIGDDSGILRLARGLNYERKQNYLLTVQAEDLGEESRFDTATISITVLDVNDRAPTFPDSPYLAYVRENMGDLPATVLFVNAHDADSSNKNFQLRYLMKEGDKESFRVNTITGEITVHRMLDREKQSQYHLTLVAIDTGTPRLTGTGMVQVMVSDDNDCDPTFEQDRYELFVMENSPTGTLVATLHAADLDEGLNSKLRYHIEGDLESLPFEIKSDTGEILTKGTLDRELKEEHKFKVVATDSSEIFQRSSQAQVTITLLDENDNFPKFDQSAYSVKIPENISPGSYVFGVLAKDADSGVNGQIRYLLGGTDADKFQINETTGVTKSLSALLKSKKPNLELEVRAVDSSPTQPLSSSIALKVDLVPSGRFPKVHVEKSQFSFSEDIRNAMVTKIEGIPASQDGRAHNFNYYIGGGNLRNAFHIDTNSGQLNISSEGLDYETARQYELWIEVSDQLEPELKSAIPIYIKVSDVNDNFPIFQKKIYNVSIPEEEPGPRLVTQVLAVDKDSGVNGQVRYFLHNETSQKYASIFEIKQESGEIYSKVKLDREEHAQYILEVEAVDLGEIPKTGTATVIINVQDINDNPMKFTRLFSVNVTENAPLGTFVIQVTSVDKDVGENANCSYSFSENPQGKFMIDSLSGNVTVTGALDRETQDEYLLKVSAVDGSWRAETLLTVTIEDVNDNQPEFESPAYNFNIPESKQSVSFVGQVTAIDRDKRGPNSVVTYALKQQSDIFSVDPVSGELFTKKPLKFRNISKRFSPENEHTLEVIAMDSGKPPLSSECSITVNVVTANNHAPHFIQKSYFSALLQDMRVGSQMLQLKAVDQLDLGVNAQLEYLLIGGNGSEIFNVDKESGWISLASDVSDKTGKSYLLQARAVDKGIPPMSDDVSVLLTITGPNNYAPVFSALSYRVIVPENEALETAIVTLSASDEDSGPNGQIRYNISRGNEQERFAIDGITGAVMIRENLDYDTKKEYRLIISATDLAFQPKSSEAELTIILTDVNDNPPYFEKPLYHAFVKENAPLKTKVFTLTAKDKDSAKNGIIRYAIVGGSGKHAFSVEPATGLIRTNKVFDYEERDEYFLDVVATNPDSNPNLRGSSRVQVSIKGVNEFVPKFVQSVFDFTVSESASIGSVIGSIQATDEDNGDDGLIYYLLVGSSNDRGFLLNSNTGALKVSRRLDRESQSRVVLSVLTKNSGSIKGNDTDEAQIVISILDGNDPPVFEKDNYKAEISEAAPLGLTVIQVKANDIDVRPSNNRFTYEILSGNIGKTFKIDPISGLISTAELLDREKVASYSLTIGAVDTGTPPGTGTTLLQVNLLDVNDSPPSLKNSSLEGSILENEPLNTKVMTLEGQDLDLSPNGGPFKFNLLSGKDGAKFKVDSKTGAVYSKMSFDREVTPELSIVIEIMDAGSPPLRSTQEVKIIVQDQNDSPSQSRNGQLLVYLQRNVLLKERLASLEPLDQDKVGQYTCRLENGQEVFEIPTKCDLHLKKLPTSKRQFLRVSGDDGTHPEVSSTMHLEVTYVDDITTKNSLVIRALGLNPAKLLQNSYVKLLTFLKSILRLEPQIWGLVNNSNGTDIILAVGGGSDYLSVQEVVSTIQPHKGHIENILEGSVIINYSKCTSQVDVCQNGGRCTNSLKVYQNQVMMDSPMLILSSPKVQLEFSCQCSSEFTGLNCELRKEPCQPKNPCESGGTCSKQGYDFSCLCPPDRTGKRCELEKSSACNSNPCQNGGSCQENHQGASYFCLCRPGFYGKVCQTASNACRPNPCQNGGECISPVETASAFPQCKCRTHYYGRYCEKSAFGFGFGSFMAFPPLDPNTNDIALVFSTNKKNSLLVYDFGEETGGRSDFVSLQLINGKAVFSYGGARTAISSISVNKFVADSRWYRVIATRNSRVVSLTVSQCKESGETCEECKPGDQSCYANEIGVSGTLNFNGQPVLIGGVRDVESILERPGQIQTNDFIGCIHSVVINGRHLNMSTPLESRSISEKCRRVDDVCEKSSAKCGAGGKCIDMWDSYLCRCEGLLAPNCIESFTPYSFSGGSFLEFRIGERYRRSQILQKSYSNSVERRKREISSKVLSFTFRTIQQDGVLLYAASGKDYTLLEMENGELKFSSQVGVNFPIRMTIPGASLTDGAWHVFKLNSQNRVLQLLIDDVVVGEELDASSAHEFLDPYLTVITLGGFMEDNIHSNKIYNGFTGCMTNFTINNEIQPLNGSGNIFDQVISHGKLTRGCSSAIAGAATAPDPLSIGVTLVILFFVFLLVAISVSFVVFRLRKREKNPLPPSNSPSNSKPSPPALGPGDVVRSHMLDGDAEVRNYVRNSKKLSGNNTCYQKPDIIERATSSGPHGHHGHSANNSPTNNGMLGGGGGISMEPELADMPECYDLENASSIAASDIDIVYHYKGFRENMGGRKSSPFRHNHHFSGNLSGISSPGIRQSPISNVLKSTPLARLSPSSELSQQTTPRILTLQDISGKPLQSALLATTQKDPMSQSERSLNISQSSSRSSMIRGGELHSNSNSNQKKRAKEEALNLNIGLTAEQIQRLNNSRHKNNSSLVSTLDDLSSEEEDIRKNNLSHNLNLNLNLKAERRQRQRREIQIQNQHQQLQRQRSTSSEEEDESGNDSFTCSEFEYDNEKRNYPSQSAEEGGESFRGSLSTLVASDDDLSYINSYAKGPNNHNHPNGQSSSNPIGWDYLLNWGPNFPNLAGVYKDIAQLPEAAPPNPQQNPNQNQNISSVPTNINLGTSLPLPRNPNQSQIQNSRYSTPRPSEEYV